MIPRGIRNNNPLNIRRSKDQWQGMKKTQSDSSFCQFETFEDGHRCRRASGHPLGVPRPLDAGRCGHGDSGEWHGGDGLAGDAKRVGEEKVRD